MPKRPRGNGEDDATDQQRRRTTTTPALHHHHHVPGPAAPSRPTNSRNLNDPPSEDPVRLRQQYVELAWAYQTEVTKRSSRGKKGGKRSAAPVATRTPSSLSASSSVRDSRSPYEASSIVACRPSPSPSTAPISPDKDDEEEHADHENMPTLSVSSNDNHTNDDDALHTHITASDDVVPAATPHSDDRPLIHNLQTPQPQHAQFTPHPQHGQEHLAELAEQYVESFQELALAYQTEVTEISSRGKKNTNTGGTPPPVLSCTEKFIKLLSDERGPCHPCQGRTNAKYAKSHRYERLLSSHLSDRFSPH